MAATLIPNVVGEFEKVCNFPLKKGGKFIRKNNKIYLKFNGIRIKNIPSFFNDDSHLVCVEYYFNAECVAVKHITGINLVNSKTHQVVDENVSLRLINFEGLSELNVRNKMPSSPGYKRNYKQERKTAKRRGETGVGSKSGDATRHRARRALAKKVGKSKLRGKDVHHKKPVKSGGSNKRSNLAAVSRRKNRSHGGKIGNRKGKARK